MKMLRWMFGLTKYDRIRNENIRRTTQIVEISPKNRKDYSSMDM
jgi:hypothetical protein